MKLALVSNYYNHHQAPFSEALRDRCESFAFVSSVEMRQERKALGYGTDTPSFVIPSHLSPEAHALAETAIMEADAIITGSAPEELIAPRIRAGKLTFRYSERPFKTEPGLLRLAKNLVRMRRHNPRHSPVYLLCAGAYVSSDYARVGLFRDRSYRWGYFPRTHRYDISALLASKDPQRILWCGRFLDWKHPDDAIEVARILRDRGVPFSLDMIGTGEMADRLAQLISAYGLSDSVHLLGSMKPEEVRRHMEQASIFLFTSDRKEGWGAVLNEAMNSGCASVASHACGSTPYLATHGKNAMVYSSGNVEQLAEYTEQLLLDSTLARALGEQAYRTVADEWNADEAARRLLLLAERIAAGDPRPELFSSGPCSLAPLMRDDWLSI